MADFVEYSEFLHSTNERQPEFGERGAAVHAIYSLMAEYAVGVPDADAASVQMMQTLTLPLSLALPLPLPLPLALTLVCGARGAARGSRGDGGDAWRHRPRRVREGEPLVLSLAYISPLSPLYLP